MVNFNELFERYKQLIGLSNQNLTEEQLAEFEKIRLQIEAEGGETGEATPVTGTDVAEFATSFGGGGLIKGGANAGKTGFFNVFDDATRFLTSKETKLIDDAIKQIGTKGDGSVDNVFQIAKSKGFKGAIEDVQSFIQSKTETAIIKETGTKIVPKVTSNMIAKFATKESLKTGYAVNTIIKIMEKKYLGKSVNNAMKEINNEITKKSFLSWIKRHKVAIGATAWGTFSIGKSMAETDTMATWFAADNIASLATMGAKQLADKVKWENGDPIEAEKQLESYQESLDIAKSKMDGIYLNPFLIPHKKTFQKGIETSQQLFDEYKENIRMATETGTGTSRSRAYVSNRSNVGSVSRAERQQERKAEETEKREAAKNLYRPKMREEAPIRRETKPEVGFGLL